MEFCHDPASELLPDYLKGRLEPSDVEQVRAHLRGCAICSRELEALASSANSSPGEPQAAARRPPLGMVLVAALILFSLIAGYWMQHRRAPRHSGSKLEPSGSALEEDAKLSLDLRSGATGRVASLPTLVLSPNVRLVTLRLSSPPSSESAYEMELRTSAGEVLEKRDKDRLTLDKSGRAIFEVRPAVFTSDGEFRVLLRESGTSEAAQEHSYAFRVVKMN